MTAAVIPSPRRIAVVGAGAVGASAAARIAERGIEVVLISAAAAGSTPVSRASFAWVNAHGKRPEQYRRLNEDGRRVHAERSDAHDTEWFARTGAEIDGVQYPDDGWVDTSAFLAAQLADLRAAGGMLRDGIAADSLDHVRELLGPVDLILVAAGAGTAALLRTVTPCPRLATSAGDDGFLARIDVDEHPLDRIRSLAGLQVRPDGPGRIAVQSLGIEAELRRTGATASVGTVWPALRAEIEGALGWRIPEDAGVRVDHAIRPHAADGLPCIGRVTQDVYVALTHSGITLAPLLAELIARDLQGDPDPRLAAFRP
ncbi:FAD-dependent oxidoreductase [Microbacterium murale]|uniref:Glycine/D-amino acid oxidase-like deaminating enzyme n=1 Tax=Microbacterium murale TaxID=1081040 RepID=A0ABU0P9Y6_9MICO|nr:FAD-dependent oxidoreductase [Microbacterium murale]MDQ0644147.1 glycine/D-amino acid oxidase-like deaminating enzyme [Microbacterium murale]